MEPILTFDVSNQHIRRTDSFRVVAKSKNYLHAKFCFLTEEWNGKGKTALFGDYPVILHGDTCLVPWEVLKEPGSFPVSVFAGDLVTTDKAAVRVYESGYHEELSETCPPTPDFISQLMELLHKKADGISYENNILSLLSGDTAIGSITISGGGREVELRNTGEEIQWRYAEDESWNMLIAVADLIGPQGPKGTSYLETVKTEMDAVVVANTLYCLGTVETLELCFPEEAEVGAEVVVIWYNAGIACNLNISGNIIPCSYVPLPNTRSELNALFDGVKWSLLWNESEVLV